MEEDSCQTIEIVVTMQRKERSGKDFGACCFGKVLCVWRKKKKYIEKHHKIRLKVKVQTASRQAKYQKGDLDRTAELSRLSIG